MGTVSV
jgi:hypothetical protein